MVRNVIAVCSVLLALTILIGVLYVGIGRKSIRNKTKKGITVCSALLALVILSGALYVGIGRSSIKNKTWNYLKQKNYSEADIQSIEVKHSFANIILSYDEWIIRVVYKDEPTSVYVYTLRDGGIDESSVSGTTDKEDLKHID